MQSNSHMGLLKVALWVICLIFIALKPNQRFLSKSRSGILVQVFFWTNGWALEYPFTEDLIAFPRALTEQSMKDLKLPTVRSEQ